MQVLVLKIKMPSTSFFFDILPKSCSVGLGWAPAAADQGYGIQGWSEVLYYVKGGGGIVYKYYTCFSVKVVYIKV